MVVSTKVCKGACGLRKPLTQFHLMGKRSNELDTPNRRRSICIVCSFYSRQSKKIEAKAANAVYNHAKNLGVTTEQFNEWGITKEYVAYLFKKEWDFIENGGEYCSNCFDHRHINDHCYSDKAKLGELTLDIIDIERYLRTKVLSRSNIRIICITANRAKARKDSTDYDISTQEYRADEIEYREGSQISLEPDENKQLVLL